MAKEKPEQRTDTRTEEYHESLRVKLTAAEIADRANRAASLLADRDRKEEEKKAANTAFKAALETMDARIRELSGEVLSGATYKAVLCQRTFDYADGKVREVRLDTHESLNERSMTDSERQMALPFEEDSKPETEEPT